MKFLKEHFEKLILSALLVSMLGSIFILMGSISTTRSFIKETVKLNEQYASEGDMIGKLDKNALKDAFDEISNPRGLLSMTTAKGDERGPLLEPAKYTICATPRCRKLIPRTVNPCPFCGAEQPPDPGDADDGGSDNDGDGIPNFVELKVPYLDPRNPADARYDQDHDNFLNVEEYRSKSLLDDGNSFPPLANLLRVVKRFRRNLPLKLTNIAKNGTDDTAKWDVYFQYYDPKRGRNRSAIVRVGGEVNGFEVVSAAFEELPPPGKPNEAPVPTPVASIRNAAGEDYKLRVGVETEGKDLYVHLVFLASRLQRHYQTVLRRGTQYKKLGDEISLRHQLSRVTQTYKVTELTEDRVVLRFVEEKRPARPVAPLPGQGASMGGDMEGAMMPGGTMGMPGGAVMPGGPPRAAPADADSGEPKYLPPSTEEDFVVQEWADRTALREDFIPDYGPSAGGMNMEGDMGPGPMDNMRGGRIR